MLRGEDTRTRDSEPGSRERAFAASGERSRKIPGFSKPLVTITVTDFPFSRFTTSTAVFRGKELQAA
jgi:hypothetical protein